MKNITYNLMLEDSLDMPVAFRSVCVDYDQETIRWQENYTDFYILHLVVGGSGILRCGGREYRLSRGCAFFLNKGVAFEYINTGKLKSAFLSTVGAVPASFALSCTDGHKFLASVDTNKYIALIADLEREYYVTSKKARLSTLAYGVLSEFFSEGEVGPSSLNEKVLSFIKRNFRSRLTLEDISCDVGISVSKLCHDFKARHGTTVLGYVINLRLCYAREIIKNTPDVSTQSVALQSGFDDVSYFCKAFKKKFGKTPMQNKVF